MMENAHVGFAIGNSEGRIVQANRTMLELIGWAEDDLRAGRLNGRRRADNSRTSPAFYLKQVVQTRLHDFDDVKEIDNQMRLIYGDHGSEGGKTHAGQIVEAAAHDWLKRICVLSILQSTSSVKTIYCPARRS